jgi:hypothetical protein
MKRILIFTISTLIFNITFAQVDSIKLEKLKQIGLHPFPAQSDLNNLTLDNKWINTTMIIPDDISKDFNNIQDLKWLEEPALENKVVMLGENHYHRYIQHLRNRMFFALNKFDYYPLIVLEAQYSLTGFVNYYLSIKNDKEAQEFFDKELAEMINPQEQYNLLIHIRRWNSRYPDKQLKVGFSDIEHDYKTTIKNIVIPYFNKIQVDTITDVDNLIDIDLGVLLPEYREKLEIATKRKLVGDYPFITHDYIKTVIDNLEALYKSYHFEFSYYRQKAIIRNLTDSAFLGKYWLGHKVFIHGGSHHTPNNFRYPDNGNFYREGCYLTYDFSYTMNKTYSINANGLARSLNSMAETKLDSCLHVGSGYRRSLNKFQKAYKKELITPDEFYFEWKIGSVDSLIVKSSLENQMVGQLINQLEWNSIMNRMESLNKKEYRNLKYGFDNFKRYDKHIYFVKSPITKARLKP